MQRPKLAQPVEHSMCHGAIDMRQAGQLSNLRSFVGMLVLVTWAALAGNAPFSGLNRLHAQPVADPATAQPGPSVTAESAPSDPPSGTATNAELASRPKPSMEDSLRQALPMLPDATAAGLIVYPKRYFDSEVVQSLPVELVASQLKQHYSIDFRSMEFVVAFLVNDKKWGPSFSSIMRFDSPVDWRTLDETMRKRTIFDQLHGKPYRRGRGPLDFSIYMLDDYTLIFAPDYLLREMTKLKDVEPVAGGVAGGLLAGVGKQLDVHCIANVGMVREHLEAKPRGKPLSGDAQIFSEVLRGAARFEMRGRITDRLALGAIVTTETGTTAEKLEQDLKAWKEALQTSFEKRSPVVQPVATDHACALDGYMARAIHGLLESCFTRTAGSRLQIGLRGNTEMHISANASTAIALDRIIGEARCLLRRKQSGRALKILSIAMNEYASVNDSFPASANLSKDGRPLLSWRVHVLPFLGYQDLYKQFRLNEPWDSEHNRKLIPRMPTVYQNPSRRSDYMTSYLVPVGDGTMFENIRRGVRKADVEGDRSSTLLLVEADHAVVWTRPQDLSLDQRDLWRGLVDSSRPGFLGASVDASVNFYERSLDDMRLEALFRRDGDKRLNTPY